MTTPAAMPQPFDKRQQTATLAVLIMLGGFALYAAVCWVLAAIYGGWQIVTVAALMTGLGVIVAASLGLVRLRRPSAGVLVAALAFILACWLANAFLSGMGVSLLVITTTLTAGLVGWSLDRRGTLALTGLALAAGLSMVAIDYWSLLPNRQALLPLQVGTPGIAAILAAGYGLVLLRTVANLSLRAKLVIGFLGVALLPLSVLAVASNVAIREAVTTNANQNLLSVANRTADSVDAFIDFTRSVLLTNAQTPDLASYLSQPAEARAGSELERGLRDQMRIWHLRDTRSGSYLLLDPSGTVVMSTSSLEIGARYAQADFFAQAMAQGTTYVSDVSFAPGATQGDLYFSKSVVDSNHRPIGVLAARFTARVFQNLVAEANGLAGPGSYGMLVTARGVQLAKGLLPGEAVFMLVDSAPPEELAALQAQGHLPSTPGLVLTANLRELAQGLRAAGEQPTFAARTSPPEAEAARSRVAVARTTSLPWQVAVVIPEEVFLAPVTEQTRTSLIVAGLSALLVSVAAALAAQVLAIPLSRLTRTAEQVAAGDLTVRAPVGARDEIGTLSRAFNSMTERVAELVGTLEQRVAQRTSQLQAAADISRATASVRDLTELLTLALAQIRDRMGYYHASIFLLDDAGDYAVLRESTGPVGAQLKARGHRLGVGSRSLIGWVTSNRQPRVASDVGEDPFYFKNPLLPETRSELAMPLMAGNRLLGALDVQSRQSNAFGESDVQVMQTLADQLSVAIENAELFARTEANLKELSTLYQRLTSASWRSSLHGQAREAVSDLAASGPATAGSVTVPLVLRGQQVGEVELQGRRREEWAPEELAALNAVVAQLASALESAALLEEAQRRRAREQTINDIANLMRASLDPGTVMQSGIRELGRALGATEVIVRLADAPAAGQAARREA